MPVAASSVWRAATAAVSSQPTTGRPTTNATVARARNGAAEGLGEARRVLVLGLRRAEPQRGPDERPGAAGQEQAGAERGRDQQVEADEGDEPGQVQRAKASARTAAETPAPKRWPRGSMNRAGVGVSRDDVTGAPGRADGGVRGTRGDGELARPGGGQAGRATRGGQPRARPSPTLADDRSTADPYSP